MMSTPLEIKLHSSLEQVGIDINNPNLFDPTFKEKLLEVVPGHDFYKVNFNIVPCVKGFARMMSEEEHKIALGRKDFLAQQEYFLIDAAQPDTYVPQRIRDAVQHPTKDYCHAVFIPANSLKKLGITFTLNQEFSPELAWIYANSPRGMWSWNQISEVLDWTELAKQEAV